MGANLFPGVDALELVEPLEDALLDPRRHGGHLLVLVVQREVVEDVLTAFVHAPEAVLDDDGDLVGERRVVGKQGRNGARQNVAVAVRVLQPFPVQGGAPGGGAQQETLGLAVRRGPHEVADALKAEHRIERVERDHGRAVGALSRARGDKGGHGAGLADALFEELPVPRLLVVQQRLPVHRLVELALGRIDAHLAEQRVHPEGPGFVRYDGYDVGADVRIPEQLAQQPHERHGGGDAGFPGSLVKLLIGRLPGHRQRLRLPCPFG